VQRSRVVVGAAALLLGPLLVVVPGLAAPAGAASTRATSSSVQPINPAAIPLGDGHLSTSPKVGDVDSCQTSFPSTGGAQVVGPWIDAKTKTWDSLTKVHVEGAVSWPNASYSVTVSGGKRVIKTNDLPDHTTGSFPVSSSDPASTYDANPNHIAAQSITWSLPANPAAVGKPSCLSGGAIGVLSDGAMLYDALDGEGRDAVAHEILDSCDGHPDQSDTYHHHDIPSCVLDAATGRSTLVGYAKDGYGIYVERNATGTLLTNASLDACHGRTSSVLWNGKHKVMYHYDATAEYPYTVGCYHGTPITTAQGQGPSGGRGGSAGPPGGGPGGPGGPPGAPGAPGGPGGP
jgi:hypothetical protein